MDNGEEIIKYIIILRIDEIGIDEIAVMIENHRTDMKRRRRKR